MTRSSRMVCTSVFFLCLQLAFAAQANDDDDQAKANRLEFMKSSAENIQIKIGDNVPAKLVGPIQRWSHPISPPVPDATVFLWTVDDRPVVAAQIFYLEGMANWSQEFSSLTEKPVTAHDRKAMFWSTRQSKPAAFPVPDSPPVATRAALRLTQMRAIARRFEAVNKADDESPNSLKLLPTPLYRFSSEKAGIVDGALFSLASGVDPEVLLLIEAHGSSQSARWRVTFAPMTIFACRVTYGDQEVWSTAFRLPPHALDSPFMYHGYISPNQPLISK